MRRRKARSLSDPTHVRARLRLGKVYVLLGDLDKAREALSSLADHPDASVARDARKAHARLVRSETPWAVHRRLVRDCADWRRRSTWPPWVWRRSSARRRT